MSALRLPASFKAAPVAVGTLVVVSCLAIAALLVVSAQSGSDAAVSELERIKGTPDAVVAAVNGEEIRLRQVQVSRAASLAGVLDISAGDVKGASDAALLDRLIDQVLLGQAAERAGVAVSDEDVTQAIYAGMVHPLNAKETPEELKKVALAMLDILGLRLEDVQTDPGVRAAYRRWLTSSRYVRDSGRKPEEMIATERTKATITIDLAVLASLQP